MYKGPKRKFKVRKTMRRPKKLSEFGHQLLEKQKLRKAYNLRERVLKNYFLAASKKKINIDNNFVQFLEQRLDNVIYRLGWAQTRPQAAQMVNHGLITVNKRTLNISSYQVKKGDVIEVKETKRDRQLFTVLTAKLEKFQPASWLEFTAKDKMKAQVISAPELSHFSEPVNISAILQFYSR